MKTIATAILFSSIAVSGLAQAASESSYPFNEQASSIQLTSVNVQESRTETDYAKVEVESNSQKSREQVKQELATYRQNHAGTFISA